MIVATKEMKIESGYCPDLSMHMGEVNRQYILVPPIDISGYSVRSEIIKPDHTFIYTDQSINADGNILFTLPEQAGAVAGYGYYIIKIYDLNTVVYSAVGNLIIDDHLIQDGMIESVAEVNGYTFPDDFMMRGDLSFIFDDTTLSNETGWTSTKIKDYVDNYVDNYVNYSTSERVVGKWIDGKPIYEKTYSFNITTIGETVTVAQNLNYIDTLVSMDGVLGNSTMLPQSSRGNVSAQTWGSLSNGSLFVFVGTSGDAKTGASHITIRYTKTND